jgi:hypothetical protein
MIDFLAIIFVSLSCLPAYGTWLPRTKFLGCACYKTLFSPGVEAVAIKMEALNARFMFWNGRQSEYRRFLSHTVEG